MSRAANPLSADTSPAQEPTTRVPPFAGGGGSEPRRVQLRRTKGWRMPENTVSVARPGRWGNPFVIGELKSFINNSDPEDRVLIWPQSREEVVAAFRWLASLPTSQKHIAELRGKNLACWCPLDQPCHADVLLELANGSAA